MSPYLFLETVCIGSLIESVKPLMSLIGWLGLGRSVLSFNVNNIDTTTPPHFVAYVM